MTSSPAARIAGSAGQVAGLRVWVDRPVAGFRATPGPDRDGPAPDLCLSFRDPPFDPLPALGACGGWQALPQPGSPGAVDAAGRLAVVQWPAGGALDAAREVRRVVPFAAALQGRPVIHAAGLVDRDRAAVLCGASGAGKSTLAALLSRRGLGLIDDDLTACERRGERLCLAPGGPALAGIFFLCRGAGPRPRCTALGDRDTFRRLLAHGFGELASARAWAAQFRHYAELAREIPGFDVRVPEGRPQETADALREWIRAVPRPVATAPGARPA